LISLMLFLLLLLLLLLFLLLFLSSVFDSLQYLLYVLFVERLLLHSRLHNHPLLTSLLVEDLLDFRLLQLSLVLVHTNIDELYFTSVCSSCRSTARTPIQMNVSSSCLIKIVIKIIVIK
jgi:hypothetical protein